MQINLDIKLTPEEQKLFTIIKEVIAQYTPSTKAFVVGGWVRDRLLGVKSDDIDIMIDNISGENFAKLITKHLNINDPHVIESNPDKTKNITTAKTYIPIDGHKLEVDFAQARKEVYSDDSRNPTIENATPEEDAFRRDLTINSIFYDLLHDQIVDFTGMGIKDLISNTIRTPLDPIKTFSDDPLRIFRTIRFSTKYNCEIDPETLKAMSNPNLRDIIKKKISKERIGQEFTKILKNPNAQYALKTLKETGLWQDIINEATKGTEYEGQMQPLDMDQKNIHHKLSVWEHTMQALVNALDQYKEADPEKRAAMALTLLMHDIGKLYNKIQGESASHPGNKSYHGHADESAKIVQYILKYLRMDNYIQQVSGLVKNHMKLHGLMTDGGGMRAIRKFLRNMGEESLHWLDIFNMSIADAQAKDKTIDPQITAQYNGLKAKLEEAITSLTPLPDMTIKPILDDNEIMQILNIKAGPWMKEVTEYVRELKDEKPDITKEEAIERIKERFKDLNTKLPPKKAASDEKEPYSVCPMHLYDAKKEELKKLITSKPYQVLSVLKQLKDSYTDEKVDQLIAMYLLALLLINKDYRDLDLLNYVFERSEHNFFDPILCSCSVGILILIDTETKDKVIEQVGHRMVKMAPEIMGKILQMLPEKVDRPNIKQELLNELR